MTTRVLPRRRAAHRLLAPPRGVRRAGSNSRTGFTIVELVVAIVILTVGLLGLASTAAVVTRQMGGGAQQTLAASLPQSRFELLASTTCAALAASPSGSAETRGIAERWTTTSSPRNTRAMLDSVTFKTNRGPRTVVYNSMRVCE